MNVHFLLKLVTNFSHARKKKEVAGNLVTYRRASSCNVAVSIFEGGSGFGGLCGQCKRSIKGHTFLCQM